MSATFTAVGGGSVLCVATLSLEMVRIALTVDPVAVRRSARARPPPAPATVALSHAGLEPSVGFTSLRRRRVHAH